MTAPREVWIKERDGKLEASRVAGRAPFFGQRFVLASSVEAEREAAAKRIEELELMVETLIDDLQYVGGLCADSDDPSVKFVRKWALKTAQKRLSALAAQAAEEVKGGA